MLNIHNKRSAYLAHFDTLIYFLSKWEERQNITTAVMSLTGKDDDSANNFEENI